MVVVTGAFPKSSMKRSKSFASAHQVPCSVSFAPNKRLCLSPTLGRRNSTVVSAALYSSSSSEDDDDSDNEACYLNNQRRARRRAYSIKQRSASFVDNKLSDAVSKYSDLEDEEEKEDENTDDDKEEEQRIVGSEITAEGAEVRHELDDRELQSTLKSFEEGVESRSHRGSVSSAQLFFSDSKSSLKKSPIAYDQSARNRCFDYLVGSIDEAWARYCDATSYAEDEAFSNVDYLPNTPASLGLSEYEDDDKYSDHESRPEFLKGQSDEPKSVKTPVSADYSSDVELKRVSSQPSSVRLQQLKDRLLKAKYYLQDFLDSDEPQDAIAFWRRWDLVKYATIELVEDDDDDEVIEQTIEDLERGRLYGCY